MITQQQFRIINRWISAVETGNPNGDYGKVTIMADGPNGERQITFGLHQTTEVGGNLKNLVKNSIYSACFLENEQKALLRFVLSPPFSCVDDKNLIAALKTFGTFLPHIQDDFFRKKYWNPACAWCEKNGFRTPLARLVAYDSWIHSGGVPMFLRKRFSESVPAAGGDEIVWLRNYVDARHQWLKYWGDDKSDKSKLLRKTIYRTFGLMAILQSGNFNLTEKPITVNGIKIS